MAEWCPACHHYYGKIRQVQQHLKQNSACLRRCADLYPPMTLDQIRPKRPKLASSGTLTCSNPGHPGTLSAASERQGLDLTDTIPLSSLRRPFVPTETVVEQPITGGTQTNVGPILAEKTSRNPTRLATVSREFSFSTIFGRALLKARESAQKHRTEQNTIPYSVPYYNYTTKEPRTLF